MFKIDNDLLIELGLGDLPQEEKQKMLRQIYETLEMRVGVNLANKMSDEQLNEFEGFIDTKDQTGALNWLQTNFPGYKDVVADELEKLKSEIKQVSSQILATSKKSANTEPTNT
ncbi:MAG TPA: DUF5663 domain-containing protein [Candidatus Saccharimonadales bacterium]|nr:DUF5663 domain-containing protein [Candidatus Saccharimonadales bacterium]